MSTPSVGFFDHLFIPPVETKCSGEAKSAFNHIVDYADTTDGAWDLFRVISQITSGVQHFASSAVSALAEKVGAVAGMAGSALAIPKILSNINGLKGNVAELMRARELPGSDALKAQKTVQAAKKSFNEALCLTGRTTEVLLFANHAKILNLCPVARCVTEQLGSAVYGIADGIELADEYVKLRHYDRSIKSGSLGPIEMEKVGQKITLAHITIARNVASLAGGVLGFAALAAGGIPMASLLFTITGTVWLTMKITAHFYNKAVVEVPIKRIS